jgi:hypothetical protein
MTPGTSGVFFIATPFPHGPLQFDSAGSKTKELMTRSIEAPTRPWKIIAAWVVVLVPIVWAIYYTFTSSLEMMRH